MCSHECVRVSVCMCDLEFSIFICWIQNKREWYSKRNNWSLVVWVHTFPVQPIDWLLIYIFFQREWDRERERDRERETDRLIDSVYPLTCVPLFNINGKYFFIYFVHSYKCFIFASKTKMANENFFVRTCLFNKVITSLLSLLIYFSR